MSKDDASKVGMKVMTQVLLVLCLQIVVLSVHHNPPPSFIREEESSATDTAISSTRTPHHVLLDAPPPLPPLPLENACSPKSSNDDFRQRSGLFVIVTGVEHSGTTSAGDTVRAIPNLFGAVELGLMLAETPQNFTNQHPFWNWITLPVKNDWWGLTKGQRDHLLNVTCHAEQYILLRQYSGIYSNNQSHSWVMDKTPAYVYHLERIMDQTPQVPVIVTWKDPQDQIASFVKRGMKPREPIRRMALRDEQVAICQKKYPERLFVLNQTQLRLEPDNTLQAMFSFLGLKYDPRYKTLENLDAKSQDVGIEARKNKAFQTNSVRR